MTIKSRVTKNSQQNKKFVKNTNTIKRCNYTDKTTSYYHANEYSLSTITWFAPLLTIGIAASICILLYYVDTQVNHTSPRYMFCSFILYQLTGNWMQFFLYKKYETCDFTMQFVKSNKKRSFVHCDACDHCISKRDYHSFLLGGCVIQQNKSYFIVFLFYASIGSLIALIWVIPYLTTEYNFFSWEMGYFFGPTALIGFLFKFYPLKSCIHLFATFVINAAVVSGLYCGLVAFHQLFLVVLGISHTEYKALSVDARKILLRRLNSEQIRINLRRIFGKYPYLALFIPFPKRFWWLF